MLARERLIEIGVSVGGVAIMLALLLVVGSSYSTTSDGQNVLTPTGGELVVYSIAAFVVLMAVAGFILIHTVTVVEAGEDASADA